MREPIHRRGLLAGAAAALALCGCASQEGRGPNAATKTNKTLFRVSLAQWSLHKMLYAKELYHLDFPRFARDRFGIDAVEYVNAFFERKSDDAYNKELRRRCDDSGVRSLLIMCDGEGKLGDPDEGKRLQAVENHRKWVEACVVLGGHSIRVNAASDGTFDEQQRLAADGLRKLCELAEPYGVDVIVENHWGLSSRGDWLAGVMRMVGHPRVGTLPDFGNFDPKEYDRYQGVTDMMPFAKGVSAKSYEFESMSGDEVRVDFERMLRIVLGHGYRGHIGIEYEGEKLPEVEGVFATKRLLERLREKLAGEFT
jgi:sugar phosphate isomerase/epimerase